MATFYLDTSALVKRYATERGTAWVLDLTDPAVGNALHTVRLTRVEMIAAFYRKVRTSEITPADAQRAEADFAAEWEQQFQIIEVTPSVIERAALLARTHPLRSYDAVHLAAAFQLDARFRVAGGSALTLLSADRAQLRAAVSEGMLVDDPNDHP